MISGLGLASARISGSFAICFSSSGFSTPPAESPRKMSAPAITSASVRASVSLAKTSFQRSISLSRPLNTTPSRSVTQMFSTLAPRLTSWFRQASAAAPAPLATILTSENDLPASVSALVTAAPTITAVPCWSSWNTGMFMRWRSCCSISKHSGALMSSRLMPPKVGSRAATHSTMLSTVVAASSMSNTSMSANFLNRTAFPSITGFAANGPMLPSPSTAVPLVTTPTRLARLVYFETSEGSAAIASETAATPGE